MPGRAAYVDGRGGSAMRLNFSGVGEDDIREGVRRIGEVVREQVAMYGTPTGVRPPRDQERQQDARRDEVGRRTPDRQRRHRPRGESAEDELAKVLRLPAKRRAG